MEPGHEDREYGQYAWLTAIYYFSPQWSPVMKTGNTTAGFRVRGNLVGLNGARS